MTNIEKYAFKFNEKQLSLQHSKVYKSIIVLLNGKCLQYNIKSTII